MKWLIPILGLVLLIFAVSAESNDLTTVDIEQTDEALLTEQDVDVDEAYPNDNAMTPAIYDKLWKNYPRSKYRAFMTGIGGQVGTKYGQPGWRNTCTLRLSYALNRGGTGKLKLKKGEAYSFKPGRWRTRDLNVLEGGDGYNYAFRVREIVPFLLNRFGTKKLVKWKNPNPGKAIGVPKKFKGKKGVIWFDVKIWNDASGHVDLFNGVGCSGHCYFSEADQVWLWQPAKATPKPTPTPAPAPEPDYSTWPQSNPYYDAPQSTPYYQAPRSTPTPTPKSSFWGWFRNLWDEDLSGDETSDDSESDWDSE